MPILSYVLAALAAVAAGLTNALAGGGTLITFPVLLAIGLPAVSANVTNTVALSPGFLGGTLAQSKDLAHKGVSERNGHLTGYSHNSHSIYCGLKSRGIDCCKSAG